MTQEHSTPAGSITERVDALWAAAEACVENEDRGGAIQLREAVAAAAAALAGKDDLTVYVTKTNATGLRNQVWQGQGKTRANDLMVLVDTSGNEAGVASEARGRLSPLPKNGFDAIVVCVPDKSGWKVRAVVEYEHANIGASLKSSLAIDFESHRVPDPSVQATLPPPAIAASSSEEDLDARGVAQHLIEAKNAILAGPPGTGKTRLALEAAQYLAGAGKSAVRLEDLLNGRTLASVSAAELQAPEVVWEIVQLHASYSYEDFVRGLRTDPSKKGFALQSVDGVLPIISAVAAARGAKLSLLIVDEINRANIATVFGETIFAMDPSHRGRPVRLQYDAPQGGDDTLTIPPSLLMLGTMNTADRSIAMVDFAVRRRFRFLSVPPSPASLSSYYSAHPARAAVARKLLAAVNGLIADTDIHVGHSYLMTGDGESGNWATEVSDKIVHEVRPLLQEYFEEGRLAQGAQVMIGSISFDLLSGPADALASAITDQLAEDVI